MLRTYKRVNILLPNKEATQGALKKILETLQENFGGYTQRDVLIVSPADGKCFNKQAGRVILDRHISVDVDIEPSNGIEIDKYFANFKKIYEKLLNEQELYITYQLIARIV